MCPDEMVLEDIGGGGGGGGCGVIIGILRNTNLSIRSSLKSLNT